MKIKFDIKYRDKIEAGKYQVILSDNTPVTIVKWDVKSPYPILAVIATEITDFNGKSLRTEERPYVYEQGGTCPSTPLANVYHQLYIDTGDKLTESERMLYNVINNHANKGECMNEDEVHEWMKENFLPRLIKDCETNGDYFVSNGAKYLHIENYSDGM